MRKIFFCILLLFMIARTGEGAEILPVVPHYSDAPVTSKVALVHYNPKLKDLAENLRRLKALIVSALDGGANFVVTPELATSGYSITESDVRSELGIQAPFKELDNIKDLAQKFGAYIVIGIAEKGANGNLYNSAVVLRPDRSFYIVRKKGIAGFNKRGDLPFAIINTKFGDVGVVICSDAYLMDVPRILALQGADIVLSPANWWGDAGQLDIWATRAHENSFYLLVANRWGKELDERFPPNKYDYDMSDAPSAAISPDGKTLFTYMSKNEASPQDKVIFQEVVIPKSRIGTKLNPSWSFNYRKPSLYTDIATVYYRPDLGNPPPTPALPAPGNLNVASIVYSPAFDIKRNREHIEKSYLGCEGKRLDVLVLPANAFKDGVLSASEQEEMRKYLAQFLKEKGLKAIITSYSTREANCTGAKTLVLTEGRAEFTPALHPFPPSNCSDSMPPYSFDLQGVRLGVVVDGDMLIPEIPMAFAKRGVDALVLSSSLGGNISDPNEYSYEDYTRLLKTTTNDGIHVISSSSKGIGTIFTSEYGMVKDKIISTTQDSCITSNIDAAAVRTKYLNALTENDLSILLDNFRSMLFQ